MDEPLFEYSVTYIMTSGREVIGKVGATDAVDALRAVDAILDDPQPRITIRVNKDKTVKLAKSAIEQFSVELIYEYTRVPGQERQKGGPKPWTGE